MKKNVEIIPSNQDQNSDNDPSSKSKRRVAAYARVSTGSEEQATSFVNQVDEWTKRIRANPEYEFVKVYTDEGISGTSEKKRIGFNEMISDAKHGKMDLILCKSISRFARNTQLAIAKVKELKKYGVEVYFDNEHLSSFDSKSEFIFSILCSMAQEESRHISENVNWTIQKKMQEGIPFCNTTRFLGYDKNEAGDQLVINEEEAEIVRRVFDLYEAGYGCLKICRILQEDGIKTVVGNTKWHTSTITGMLRNEKYKGELLLQKTFTSDYLGHVREKNKGQRSKYRIENAHEAIISKEQFDRVQKKLNLSSNKQIGANINRDKYNYRYPLSGILICMKCGNKYKRRTINSNSKYMKHAYSCNSYINHGPNGEWCYSKPLSETITHQACCDIINGLFLKQTSLFTKMATLLKKTLSQDRMKIDEQAKAKQKEQISTEIARLMEIRLDTVDQTLAEEYDKKIKELLDRNDRIDTAIKLIREQEEAVKNTSERMQSMLDILKKKKVDPSMLTSQMIKAFFYKILVISPNELVFVVNVTNKMTDKEIIADRDKISKLDPIYEGEVNGKDPKPTTIKYKVVLI